MNCTPNLIDERSEATIQVQLLDHRNVPMLGTEFDSILFTLHDEAGNIVNAQENIEVLEENGGTFIPSYSIAVSSVTRHDVVISTLDPHDMRDGYIGMVAGLPNGGLPPNGTPAPYRTLGPHTLATRRAPYDIWDDTALGATLAAGIFRLALSADDTAIVVPVPPLGKIQERVALLRLMSEGVQIKAEEIRFAIVNLQLVS